MRYFEALRDSLEEITKKNAIVIGISTDTVDDAKKSMERLNLNFPLLSDEYRLVINDFNASCIRAKDGKTLAKSVTVIVDKNGNTLFRNTTEYLRRMPVDKLISKL